MKRMNVVKNKIGTFIVALHEAEPGTEIIYWIGCGRPEIDNHFRDAYSAGQAGLCYLYQRRLGQGLFEYMAKKPVT